MLNIKHFAIISLFSAVFFNNIFCSDPKITPPKLVLPKGDEEQEFPPISNPFPTLASPTGISSQSPVKDVVSPIIPAVFPAVKALPTGK